MPLAGDLSGFGIDEVIVLLMNSGKSGRLLLARDGDESVLFFDRGALVEAFHGPVHGLNALKEALVVYSAGRFAFEEGEQAPELAMHIEAAQLPELAREARAEAGALAPALPDADEKLTLALSFAEQPSLTPLQWVLLAQLSRRCTLRRLSQGRDPSAVKKALAYLLQRGMIVRTGQILAPGTAGVRLVVVKGYTREEEVVELDQEILSKWRDSGSFTGMVSVGGRLFSVLAGQGLGQSIVMSAAACRLCGVRDAQEVDVVPAG